MMRRRTASLLPTALIAALASSFALATDEPMMTTARSSPPAAAQSAGGFVPPMVAKLKSALADVDLSDDQRTKVDALLAHLRSQLQDVGSLSPEERQDTLRQVLGDGRRKLGEILSAEQQLALRDRMQKLASPTPAPAAPPAPKARPTEPAPEQKPAGPAPVATAGGDGMTAATPKSHPKPVTEANAPAAPVAEPPGGATGAVGTKLPAEFSLKRLGNAGGVLTPKVINNKVSVIEFASYSAPSFRYRNAAMDALDKRYGARGVEFYVVYTAEAYPAGEWDVDRNKSDNILIPRHADYNARLAAATRMRDTLKPLRPVVVDDFNNPLAKAVRAGPHTVLVIGRDGVIAARQQWCDPGGLERHIDAALAVRPEKKE